MAHNAIIALDTALDTPELLLSHHWPERKRIVGVLEAFFNITATGPRLQINKTREINEIRGNLKPRHYNACFNY